MSERRTLVSSAGLDARQAVARVRELHHEYLPAHVEITTCAHCNTLHEWPQVEPWPCPTIQALRGQDQR